MLWESFPPIHTEFLYADPNISLRIIDVSIDMRPLMGGREKRVRYLLPKINEPIVNNPAYYILP